VIAVYGCQQRFDATNWALVVKPFFYAHDTALYVGGCWFLDRHRNCYIAILMLSNRQIENINKQKGNDI
jgi:hypothetical protein